MQVDICDLRQLRRYNRGVSYYLIAIDCFSRYAFFRPLKRKTAAEAAKAFKSILENDVPFPVQRVVHDDGGEWRREFAAVLREKNIQQNWARRHPSYVERLQGTLKSILARFLKEKESLDHASIFAAVVESYNHRWHRIIKCTPAQAIRPENTVAVRYAHAHAWKKREDTFQTRKPKFDIGDLVRVQLRQHTFSRTFHQTYSTEIFRIAQKHVHLPSIMYSVESLDGKKIFN